MTFSRNKLKKDTLDPPEEEEEEEDEEEEEEETREPQVVIHLTSTSAAPDSEIIFDFDSGNYRLVHPGDPLIHLFHSPSRILSCEEYEWMRMQKEGQKEVEEEVDEEALIRQKKDEEDKQKQQYMDLQNEIRAKKMKRKRPKKSSKTKNEEEEEEEEKEDEEYDVTKDIEELYGSVMTSEQLAKLDSQPNPFNFSDRVTQSFRTQKKELAQQTDQPPSTTFGATAGLSVLCDAYDSDYLLRQEKERRRKEKEAEEAAKEEAKKTEKKEAKEEKEMAKRKERKSSLTTQLPLDPVVLPPPPEPPGAGGLNHLSRAAKIVERSVQQNIYAEVIHDYKYWEDQSDDYRQLEGSLLPLWKFTTPLARRLLVADVCWSPAHPDLLAAAYTGGDGTESCEAGFLCLYSFKNASVPERCVPCPCGVTCLQFHPTKASVLACGREDGAVFVYDARHALEQPRVVESGSGGKHLLGVIQVAWVTTGPGHLLAFLSVGRDGRVTNWTVQPSCLEPTDVLRCGHSETSGHLDRVKLKGAVTCLALKPSEPNLLLLGLDSGEVVEMTLTASTHVLAPYPAHKAPVRLLKWNEHHEEVFASASMDWMVKVWARKHKHPLVTLDLGAPVAGLTWSHLAGSLLVGVTEDGKVHVHDLYLRKCKALCVQNLVQRRRFGLSCVGFSPFHPVLLVGGERGYLVSLKLSPNLRRTPKEAKGADENQKREIEMARLGRLISTAPTP